MGCYSHKESTSWEKYGSEFYAGERKQKCNKEWQREVWTYELTRLVQSASMCLAHYVAVVDGRQAVKLGGKSCFDLIVTSRTHH